MALSPKSLKPDTRHLGHIYSLCYEKPSLRGLLNWDGSVLECLPNICKAIVSHTPHHKPCL